MEYSLVALRKKWEVLQQLDAPWMLVVLCLLERIVLDFTPNVVGT